MLEYRREMNGKRRDNRRYLKDLKQTRQTSEHSGSSLRHKPVSPLT